MRQIARVLKKAGAEKVIKISRFCAAMWLCDLNYGFIRGIYDPIKGIFSLTANKIPHPNQKFQIKLVL